MQTLLQETISSSSGISRGPTIEVTPVPHDNTVEPPASDATNGESPYAPHQAITNKNRYTKSAPGDPSDLIRGRAPNGVR